jgi:hypothetical protein
MAAPVQPAGSLRGDTMLRMFGAAAAHHASSGKEEPVAFQLAELPHELAEALRDYDLDGDNSVSVTEIAMGAHLLRRQRQKARGAPTERPRAARAKPQAPQAPRSRRNRPKARVNS